MKKIFSFVLSVVLVTSLLVGCGGNKDAEQNKDNNNSKKSTSQGKKQPNKKENVSLNLYFRSSNADIAKKAVEAFEAENENIKINFVSYPNKDYKDKLMVQLAGGGDVDVYDAGNSAWYADYVDKKQALSLDNLIKKDNFNVAPYGHAYEELRINGHLYGLPVVDSIFVLFYNKNLFDKAGVSYPKNDMTWKEFRELAKKMTSGEGNDKIWGAYFHKWPQCWYGYALQKGATIVDKDLEPFKEALQFRVDLEKDGSIMPYTEAIATNAHYNSMFQSGKVAMNPIGNWHIGQLWVAQEQGNIDFDWDIVPMPHPEGVSPNTTWGMTGQVCIQAKTKHVDESWKLVKFLCGDKGAKIFAKEGRLSGYKTDEIKKIYMGDGSKRPKNMGILFNQKVYLENPALSKISVVKTEIFDKESQLTFAGERSVDDTMKVIKQRIEKEFNN